MESLLLVAWVGAAIPAAALDGGLVVSRAALVGTVSQVTHSSAECDLRATDAGFPTLRVPPTCGWSALGLRSGDVLKRVNGFSLDTPAGAIGAHASLLTDPGVEVDFERQGVLRTVTGRLSSPLRDCPRERRVQINLPGWRAEVRKAHGAVALNQSLAKLHLPRIEDPSCEDPPQVTGVDILDARLTESTQHDRVVQVRAESCSPSYRGGTYWLRRAVLPATGEGPTGCGFRSSSRSAPTSGALWGAT